MSSDGLAKFNALSSILYGQKNEQKGDINDRLDEAQQKGFIDKSGKESLQKTITDGFKALDSLFEQLETTKREELEKALKNFQTELNSLETRIPTEKEQQEKDKRVIAVCDEVKKIRQQTRNPDDISNLTKVLQGTKKVLDNPEQDIGSYMSLAQEISELPGKRWKKLGGTMMALGILLFPLAIAGGWVYWKGREKQKLSRAMGQLATQFGWTASSKKLRKQKRERPVPFNKLP